MLFLQIPNSGALAPQVLHADCNMFDGLEHVCLYNPTTIRQIMERRGHTVRAIGTVIPELYAVRNHLAYLHPYSPDDEPAPHPLLSLITEEQILSSLLGYKLQVVVAR